MNYKVYLYRTLGLVLLMTGLRAQAQQGETAAPKWTAKVQKSIVSLIAYDQNNEMIHEGPAAYVSADGVAIANYDLVRDAYNAIVVDKDGKKSNVVRVLGADEMYGVVKLKTDANKTTPLSLATSTQGVAGTTTYALRYQKEKHVTCPTATVEKKDVVEGTFAYYMLSTAFDEKHLGALLFSEEGTLLGVVQSPIDGKSCACDANYAKNLSIAAIQSKAQTLALNNIHLKKGLPESKEEALVYIYFKSRTAGNDEYIDLVNLFVDTYPDVPEGYLRRATPLIDLHRFDEADRDLQTYLKLATDKMEANAGVADVIYTKLRYQPEPKYEKWTHDVALSYVDQAMQLAQTSHATAATDSARNEVDGRLLKYTLQKALILNDKKDYAGAARLYDEVNNGSYRTPATLYAASLAHQNMGDSLSVCIQLLDSAIALFPTPKPQEASNYYLRRGELLAAQKRYREAVADYNQFAFLNNSQVTPAFYYQRYLLEKNGRMYQQALDDIMAASNAAPKEPLYLVEKSGMLLIVNQVDESIEAARQCIALDPENSDAYRIMGYAQIQKGDKTAARQNLQKAVELGDESAQELIDQFLK